MQNNINNTNLQVLKTLDLSSFSQDNISFLSDQITNKNLYQIGYYHFFKIPQLELSILRYFLQLLDYNKAYIVLPILATQEVRGDGPIWSLSKQILVTRNSNAITISSFLYKQIEIACLNYGIEDLEKYTVVLKFRPITMKEEIVEKASKIQYETQEAILKRKHISLKTSRLYNGSIIPLSMDLSLYGEQLTLLFSTYYNFKFKLNPKGLLFRKDEFVIYIYVDGTKHEGILFKEKAIIYKFEDVLIEGSKFIRTTDNFIIYIDNLDISYFEKLTVNKYITHSKTNARLNTNIATFDIETYIKDGKFVPFACGWFDGGFVKTYYLTDFKSPQEMLLEALKDLLDFNANAKVYIHNLSNFDYMFLIKLLYEHFIIKPRFKENKVISLKLTSKDNPKITLEIFDSYLILPSSLRTLADKYNVEVQKGFFPYNFVNENNLNYVGFPPAIALFDGITEEEYGGLFTPSWDVRDALTNYLESDLKALYQVVFKFAMDIFDNEKIDITNLPTISSASFKIFKANYLLDSKLPVIKGNAHNEMRNAYYGGVVEVFKNEGTNLKYYDVTSLYPFAMLNDMPTGNTMFSTDPNINNYFGIVFVEIDTTSLDPRYLNYPLLPHKVGGRMFNPLGKWIGWYLSEEIKLAISVGYTVKVIYGYKFERTSNIFNAFINKYLSIKAGLSNITMDRTIAKMILNSLYWRLGMKPNQDNLEIVTSSMAEDILSKFIVKEQYQITERLEF